MKKAKHVRLISALIMCAVLLQGRMPASAVSDAGLDKNEIFGARDIEPADVKLAAPLTLSDGQEVTIDSAGAWVLRGTASDVTIHVDAGKDAEVTLFLDGVNISNRDTPCIYVEKAGKVTVTLASDSALSVRESFRKDSKTKANAAIYSRADLTLNGDAARY